MTANGEIVLQKALIEIENTDLDFFGGLETRLPSFNENIVRFIDKNKEYIAVEIRLELAL
ncbi:MAG: hypothetical protein EOO45_11285 [Flavobacterium sp.]|nr:MAG: hypothetical protein EOO45_11285 [Flavobacterium sp.]